MKMLVKEHQYVFKSKPGRIKAIKHFIHTTDNSVDKTGFLRPGHNYKNIHLLNYILYIHVTYCMYGTAQMQRLQHSAYVKY